MPLRTRLLVEGLDRAGPPIADMSPEQIRASRTWAAPTHAPFTWVTGPMPRDVAVETSAFAARDGHEVPVRVYRPKRPALRPRPVLMFFHGGGWVLGNVRGYDPLCARIAHDASIVVVSVDYRLAPEHRAPTAAHDCVDATRWVTDQAWRLGVDPVGLGVAGDSAGGNLAAVVSQVVRDEGGADIGYQCLLYPGVDATMSSPSITLHADAPVLTKADIEAFLAHYIGSGPDALATTDPLLSPLHAPDLSRLPPALVQTADLDPLRDEGAEYALALHEAGGVVQRTNYPGAPHGFMSFPGATRVGRAARRELSDWVIAHTRPSGG